MRNKFKKNKGLPAQSGFTLVELIVAVALFTLVAFISLGALLTIFDANRKTQATKTVTDNLNLTIENMARTVRFGSNYYCGISTDNTIPIETNNCDTGDTALSVTFKGSRIIYTWEDGAIKKSEGGGAYESITSLDTTIDYMRFYVFNSTPSDSNQPYVIAVIKGHSGSKPTLQTDFSIETLMSQMTLDL